MFPHDIRIADPESESLIGASDFTQEIKDHFGVFNSARDGSLRVQLLAHKVFLTHNRFVIYSDMLAGFLDFEPASPAGNRYQNRKKVRHLKVVVDSGHKWHSRNRDFGNDLRSLRDCPKLKSLHVVVRAVPWLNYLGYELERITAQIWTALEELKERLGPGMKVSMKAEKPDSIDYLACPYTGQTFNDYNDEPPVFRYLEGLVLFDEFKMLTDITRMWEPPTDAVRSKYLNSEQKWLEELNVLMFDEEGNKEARVNCDTDSRPLSKNMDLLKARPKMEGLMRMGSNETEFHNSKLRTREAFALVEQRFANTGSSTEGHTPALPS